MDVDAMKQAQEMKRDPVALTKESPTAFCCCHVTYVARLAKCNLITASDIRWESQTC